MSSLNFCKKTKVSTKQIAAEKQVPPPEVSANRSETEYTDPPSKVSAKRSATENIDPPPKKIGRGRPKIRLCN